MLHVTRADEFSCYMLQDLMHFLVSCASLTILRSHDKLQVSKLTNLNSFESGEILASFAEESVCFYVANKYLYPLNITMFLNVNFFMITI